MSRVFLTSGDATFGAILRNAFKAEGDLDVCGETENGVGAVEKAMELLPDLVILEMGKPRTCDLEVAKAIKTNMPETPVFLVTEQHGMQAEKDALSHGIDAVFQKYHDFPSLVMNARAICGLE